MKDQDSDVNRSAEKEAGGRNALNLQMEEVKAKLRTAIKGWGWTYNYRGDSEHQAALNDLIDFAFDRERVALHDAQEATDAVGQCPPAQLPDSSGSSGGGSDGGAEFGEPRGDRANTVPGQALSYDELVAEVSELRAKLNAPELLSFRDGAVLEAAHQRNRWRSDHDAGKEPQDWFWLVGYLSGKALRSHLDGDSEKALHHTISSAAVLANWHAAILGANSVMRPGISAEKQETVSSDPNGLKSPDASSSQNHGDSSHAPESSRDSSSPKTAGVLDKGGRA